MYPIALNAAIPLTYLEQNQAFFSLFATHRDLLFGFLSQCPFGNRKVMKEAYVASKHEDEWNQKREAVCRDTALLFEKEIGAKLKQENPHEYNYRKYRFVLEEESRCLDKELQHQYPNTPCGFVRLKNVDGSYCPRWPQVFFNIGDITKEDREKAAKELEGANDYTLLEKNICCADGVGGRSVLGMFSMAVSSFIGKEAQAILKNHKITVESGGLSTCSEALKQVPRAERHILLIDRFSDMVAATNALITNSSLRAISNTLNLQQMPNIAPIKIVPASQVATTFPAIEKTFVEMTKKAKIPEKYKEIFSGKEHADIHGAINGFYAECEMLYKSLSDFLALMDVHTNATGLNDVTKAVSQMKITSTAPLRRSANSTTKRFPSRNQSPQVTPQITPQITPLVSPAISPRSAPVSPREPTTPFTTPPVSPRASLSYSFSGRRVQSSSKTENPSPKVSPRGEDYSSQLLARRLEYYKVFECTQRVLASILERKH